MTGSGCKRDSFIATAIIWIACARVVFPTGDGILSIGKIVFDSNINTAKEVDDFGKGGEIDNDSVIHRLTGDFRHSGLG